MIDKPDWLQKRIKLSQMREVEEIVKEASLHTICQEALCPNISECFSKKTATFLILGNRCTRRCTYCNVSKDIPLKPDENEPKLLAQSVQAMGLKYVVITSPTRDDLKDGGANHFKKCVEEIKKIDENIIVELLIPDMKGDREALKIVANSGATVIGHNVETVPRLYNIRKGANYKKSLNVLKTLLKLNPDILTKSAIMVGLGEREDEVLEVMQDLIDAKCYFLSIGQYLAPSKKHAPVVEYVHPKKFEYYYKEGIKMGFKHIKSSPYTRSSYMAHEYLFGTTHPTV